LINGNQQTCNELSSTIDNDDDFTPDAPDAQAGKKHPHATKDK
jgi:hypothetical protein